ncbi:MAG: hypothetical protein WAT22_10035 [Saprospiraceae bacterium]
MKIHQILSLILITTSLQAQSLTFVPTTTLFSLDGAHWSLSQPMIPSASIDGKHVDFYGLTGSTGICGVNLQLTQNQQLKNI